MTERSGKVVSSTKSSETHFYLCVCVERNGCDLNSFFPPKKGMELT